MSKSNSKSLTSMIQKLRKYCKEMEPELAPIREQPELAEQEENEKCILKFTSCISNKIWIIFNQYYLFCS